MLFIPPVKCSLNTPCHIKDMCFTLHAWLKMGGIRGHQEQKSYASYIVGLIWLEPKDFVSFGELVVGSGAGYPGNNW